MPFGFGGSWDLLLLLLMLLLLVFNAFRLWGVLG